MIVVSVTCCSNPDTMLNVLWRTYIVHHGNYHHRFQPTQKLHLLQKCQSLCLSSSTTTTATDKDTFKMRSALKVSYLMDTCGFSLKSASSASKYLQFDSPKADSVINMFKAHGFSPTQISVILRKHPQILCLNPDKVILPKLQFFQSRGAIGLDLARVFTRNPGILLRSLENYIIPNYSLFRDFLQSDEKTIRVLRRGFNIFQYDFESQFLPKINILLDSGVPKAKIAKVFCRQPHVFDQCPDRFKMIVEEIKKMGFNPSSAQFVVAVAVVNGVSKSNWERKLDVYKRWGWSKEDVLAAFKRFPTCMAVSEDKITAVMNVLVNNTGLAPSPIAEYPVIVGWESSQIVKYPYVLGMNLENRILPRVCVLWFLLSRGLRKKVPALSTTFGHPEEIFLEKYVNCYEEGPHLLKLYRGKLHLAAKLDDSSENEEYGLLQ